MKKYVVIMICLIALIAHSSNQIKRESAERDLYNVVRQDELFWVDVIESGLQIGEIDSASLLKRLTEKSHVVQYVKWDDRFDGVFIATVSSFSLKEGYLLTCDRVKSVPVKAGCRVSIINESALLCIYELSYYWD